MKLLEGKFFKDWCIFLGEQDNRYFILYGKIGQIKFEVQTDSNNITFNDIDFCHFIEQKTASVNIPFITKNDKLFTIINIHNKEEYHTIVEILEDIL